MLHQVSVTIETHFTIMVQENLCSNFISIGRVSSQQLMRHLTFASVQVALVAA